MEKKILHEIKFLQKFKDFYSNKINSIPKKLSFWILAVILFIFLLPFCLGGILVYLISKIKTGHFLIKAGLIILISIVTLSVEIGWTKNLLGTNTPSNLVISNPTAEETKIKVPLSIDRNYYVVTIDDKFTVNGTTSPEAKVVVNEKEAEVDGQGQFSVIIPLKFGENLIKITAEIDENKNNASIKIERITQKEKDKREADSKKEKAENKEIQTKSQIESIVKKTNSTAGTKITKNGDRYEVSIAIAASDNAFGNKYIKLGIQEDMTELYKTLFNSGLPISIIKIGAVFPMMDKYGNESNDIIYATELSITEAKKVNWDGDSAVLALQIMPRVWTLSKSSF